jgi:hypothetical protein
MGARRSQGALRVAGLPRESVVPECLPQSRRTELVVRLSNWNRHGEMDQIQADVYLIDGLLPPGGALTDHVTRWVWPPLGLSSAYLIHSAAGLRGGYRALQPGKLPPRYTWALWQLRPGRTWSPPVLLPNQLRSADQSFGGFGQSRVAI